MALPGAGSPGLSACPHLSLLPHLLTGPLLCIPGSQPAKHGRTWVRVVQLRHLVKVHDGGIKVFQLQVRLGQRGCEVRRAGQEGRR